MKILETIIDLNKAINTVDNLGFVPTMGSLHKGHISLIKNSKKQCSKTIVSIFINPTQFNNKKDFLKYPKNLRKDYLILKKLKVDFVFVPKKNEIYKSKRISKIRLSKKDKILCAKYRQGHFEGVLGVMNILTSLIKPNKIFMGEKDFQQLYLVKNFIEQKNEVKIISCKTVRNKNKLALSSRNSLLNKEKLIHASKLINHLIKLKKKLKNKENIKNFLSHERNRLSKQFRINIEYLELRNIYNLRNSNKIKNSRIFIAFYIDKIRLIDNF